jgi:hypothetical protein
MPAEHAEIKERVHEKRWITVSWLMGSNLMWNALKHFDTFEHDWIATNFMSHLLSEGRSTRSIRQDLKENHRSFQRSLEVAQYAFMGAAKNNVMSLLSERVHHRVH